MKYFWIFIAVIFVRTLFAQQDTLYLYQAYTSFSNPEKAEWTAFENNWNYFAYADLKKTQGLKELNCKNCESFYAELYLELNKDGAVTIVHFLKGKRCGREINDSLLKKQFEATLHKQRFTHLKNRAFKARLGHVLKC